MNPKIDAILRRMGFKCYNYHEDRHGKTAQYVNMNDSSEIVTVIHAFVDDEEDWENVMAHLDQGEYIFDWEGNPTLVLNGHGNYIKGEIYKQYLVISTDESGRDYVVDVFDTKDEAKKLYEEHKGHTSYARYELSHAKYIGDGAFEYLDNDTIESYYEEDEWKEGLDENDLEHLAEGCISSLEEFKENRKLHHKQNARNPEWEDTCAGCKAIAIKLGLEEE